MAKTKEEKLAHAKELTEFDSLFGYELLAGVDEAGRGPLAGPVFAAAVILPRGLVIEGIDDSKKLSEKKREELFEIITHKAIAYAIASEDEKVIDEINIRNATYKAMNKAVDALKVKAEFVIVDGDAVTNMETPHSCIIKGDAKSLSIGAASILAKVSRDRYLYELDKKYPQYAFSKHKGYGTKLHNEMILKYGPCPAHRRSFLKKLLKDYD
ncbi:MAG: ribonuclease HII [Clostridia bacterium]|nr:ribonuclease HII [Clostridia bacterium]